MSYLASPEFYRVALLGVIVSLQMTWRGLANTIVPQPYLDEVFHVPQAQAYWGGRWSQWDPKLTTPPGLYLFSHAINTCRTWINPEFQQTTDALRFVNVVLLYSLLISLYVWTTVSRQPVNHDSVMQREFSVIYFPLLFFFSGLYYTDLFSAFTVIVTYIFWSASSQATGGVKVIYQLCHLLTGLLSLGTRQTNIFWVAVFLGGLQVVDSVKKELGAKEIHDSPISDAYFEDFPITSISIAQHALHIIPTLVLDLWPQISLLVSFAAFVYWNGGVVLGDKSNHIATLHVPQMLYIWPFIAFFSWPVFLPFAAHLLDRSRAPTAAIPTIRSRFPRLATLITFSIVVAVVINTNTILHPFTLADNRHYTFYVFRILTRHWLVQYTVAVPAYLGCAWLAIGALGRTGSPTRSSNTADTDETVRVSFVLVWLIATTLSLITAPLVEPRYFIIPWLIWRLHVPEPSSHPTSTTSSSSTTTPFPLAALQRIAPYSTWIELGWYTLINAATCYLFLYRGFEWKQEPGATQRFMW